VSSVGGLSAGSLYTFNFGSITIPVTTAQLAITSGLAASMNSGKTIYYGASNTVAAPLILASTATLGSPAITLSSTTRSATVTMSVTLTPKVTVPSGAGAAAGKIVITLAGAVFTGVSCTLNTALSFTAPASGASGTAAITTVTAGSIYVLTVSLTAGTFNGNNAITFTFGTVVNPTNTQSGLSNLKVVTQNSGGIVLGFSATCTYPAIT